MSISYFEKYENSITIWMVVAAIVALGFCLRMIPVRNNPSVDLVNDASFNYRMCQEFVSHGKVPEVDNRSMYPVGKKVHEEVPVFLYYATGIFHFFKVIFTGNRDLKMSIFCFNSLCGAMIAVPVFLLALSITKKTHFAMAASLIAATYPMGIHRTSANYFRFEVMGIFLILMCITFFIRALDAPNLKGVILESAISGIFLFLSIGTWRMTLLFFMVLSVAVLLEIIFCKNIEKLSLSYLILLSGFILSCLFITCLQSHNYIFSTESFSVIIIGIITAVFNFFKKREGSIQNFIPKKIMALIVVLLVGLFVILFVKSSPSGSLNSTALSLSRMTVARLFGVPQILSPDDLLFENCLELKPVPIANILHKDYFSWGVVLLLLYFFMIYKDGWKTLKKKDTFLIFFLTVIFLSLMLFSVSRILTLAAPLVAIAMALGLQSLCGYIEDRYSVINASEKGKRHVNFVSAVGVIIMLMLVLDSNFLMMSVRGRGTRYSPVIRKTLMLLKKNTPSDAVIWAHWQYGYPIQTYSERATVIDGLFEIPEMRRRVLEQDKVLWSENGDDIINYCKKYNISYIFLAKTTLPSPAEHLGLNFREYYADGSFTEKGKRLNIVRMFNDPDAIKGIKILLRNEGFRVFYVSGDDRQQEKEEASQNRLVAK